MKGLYPKWYRCRAATSPSPPLLPGPHMTSTRGYALTPYTCHNMSQIDAITVTLVCQKLKWPSDFNYEIKYIKYAISWSYEPDEILENKTFAVVATNQMQCGWCLCLIYRTLLVFNSLSILGDFQLSIMEGFSPKKNTFYHPSDELSSLLQYCKSSRFNTNPKFC